MKDELLYYVFIFIKILKYLLTVGPPLFHHIIYICEPLRLVIIWYTWLLYVLAAGGNGCYAPVHPINDILTPCVTFMRRCQMSLRFHVSVMVIKARSAFRH